MKYIITVVSIFMIFSTSVLAHQEGSMAMNRQGMPMMDQDQMALINRHMQTTQYMMENIQQEKDPEKRNQLLQEHQSLMHQGMHMMNQGGSAGNKKGQSVPTDNRMDMMEQRMGMMQMMMGQMMAHETEQYKQRNHRGMNR